MRLGFQIVPLLALILVFSAQLSAKTEYDGACLLPYDSEPANQGLSARTQAEWWWTGQGSQVIPYRWFLHLEQADSRDLFRRPAHMEQFGYFFAPADFPAELAEEFNPDGLPIGFARSIDPHDGEAWFGPSCASCHSSEMRFAGRADPLIIDGGAAMADFWAFNLAITEALVATYEDEDKLARFAQELGMTTRATREALVGMIRERRAFDERNKHEHAYGHARVDAFGVIFNQVVAGAMGMEENAREPNAPVSYPFLWNTHQANRVQWNGIGDNMLPFVGPIARNAGEVMGVYGKIEIDMDKKTVKTSAVYDALLALENAMKQIRAPLWPSHQPAIDRDRCFEGQKVYEKNCEYCHGYVSHKNQMVDFRNPSTDTHNEAILVPYWEIGTDPLMAVNAYRYTSSGPFQGDPIAGRVGPRLAEYQHSFDLVGHVVILSLQQYKWQILGEMMKPSNLSQFITHAVHRGLMIKSPEMEYKARPLKGIWATAPYLHNGSVPNLRQMLLLDQRASGFCVGSTLFDPEAVGYEQMDRATCEAKNYSWLDTSVPGNGNFGHYKTNGLLTTEREALLEFLKTL
ncbi:MAG: di-heme-cytochrome C peroxidase [Pseudomonadota bacterium]